MSARTGKKAKQVSSKGRVATYRIRMRAKGMRLVQFWVPDVRSPKFAAEARRQSLAVAKSKHEKKDQAFIDAVSSWSDE